MGPESSGKSTLCAALAAHYDTIWVPEYARQYLEENGADYTYADLESMASGQLKSEDLHAEKAEAAGKALLFIDTEMYVMKIWSEYVFNACSPAILNEIVYRPYDLYLLCAPDLPWEDDPLREYPDPAEREKIFQYYLCLLYTSPSPRD